VRRGFGWGSSCVTPKQESFHLGRRSLVARRSSREADPDTLLAILAAGFAVVVLADAKLAFAALQLPLPARAKRGSSGLPRVQSSR
jgi:hypothetical protein